MITFPITNADGWKIINNGEEVYLDMPTERSFMGLLKQRADGRTIFVRPNLNDEKHFFRKTQSYSLDWTLTKALSSLNAVLFFETDSGNYYTTADYMLAKGTVNQYGFYNTQVFLERALFTKTMP